VAKNKVSVTIDQAVLAAADADARAAGLNRSEMIERALRNEHLRISLENYTTHTVPTLDIDAYAQTVYQANRATGL
jgi:metal-responsive CopG/Arc/MetJ family transcriptional regulator